VFDFPNAPTLGQEVTTPGGTYIWNGTKWTSAPGVGGGGGYLPLTGGTMSGAIDMDNNQIIDAVLDRGTWS
jgi:hypothetical protein